LGWHTPDGLTVRILFVHEVNYSSKVIYEMHEFPELLALAGHDVAFFHFPESPPIAARSMRTRKRVISGRAYPDAKITLITPPTLGGKSWERYAAPIANVPALRREIKRGGYDVIVLYAVPTTGWQSVYFARKYRVPLVFRALDVSHMIRSNVLSRLIKAAEKYVYRGATLLSANNPAMERYCVEVAGRIGPTVVNLPPVDLSHFATPSDVDRRSELGLTSEHKVLLYMGSFFAFSGLDVVVAGLVHEFNRHPELRLVLVGGGELDARLRSLVSELGLADRVIFTGVVAYQDLPGYLAIADVAINPFLPQLVTNVALPHKVLQYLAAGAPTVSTSLEGLRAIVGDDAGVIWVDQPSDVASAATDLAYLSSGRVSPSIDEARQEVLRRFSKDAARASFEETARIAYELGTTR
jgi:glycosyltransferase involved in cell wall biosynthesis